MPRLQDIERFKRDLAALAHEEEVLARWGENPNEVTPPEAAAAAAEGEASPGAPDADLAALLEPFEAGEEGAALEAFEAEPSEEGPAAPAEEFSLDDLDLGLPPEAAPAESPAETFEFPEPAAEDGAPEEASPFDIPGLDAESAPEAPAAEAEPFEMPDLGSLEDLGGPAPEAEAAAIEALPEAEGLDLGSPAAPVEAADEGDFSIPDMGFGEEPSPGAEGRIPGAEEPAFAEEAPSDGIGAIGEASAAATDFEAAGDSFESFSFEEGGLGEEPRGAPAAGSSIEREIADLRDEAPIEGTFALDQDWGDFGEVGGAAPPPRQAPPRPRAARPGAPAEEKARPVALNEAQVDRLQDSLLGYPLNLRVAVEDILANEKGTEAQRSRLVWAMVDGLPIEEPATLAGRVLKRHIPIPKGYEKKTGAAVEAERGTFRYALVHTILPAIRTGILALAAVALVVYLGWRYVYTPLAADALYRSGYARLAEDRFPEAEASFERATRMREFVVWYYRYAEAYRERRQYILAEKKYQALLDRHPRERKGALDWARLEREQLKYDSAVRVLKKRLLEWDYFNKEGLLLQGDVYLDWAEEDPRWYEEARRSFATLIERYGQDDVFLERMLRYFIAIDDLKEVLPLKARFLGEKKNPLGAVAMAELGGYLLDKGKAEEVREILAAAVAKDRSVPESHYELARYFRLGGSKDEERKALDNAVRTFRALPGLGSRRTAKYVESLIWRGWYRVRADEWIGAEEDFATAAAEYEKAVELRRLKPGARFRDSFAGEAYAGLAEVAYRQRNDLASALGLLERAARNGYDSAEARYKRGFVLYRLERFADSLEQFYMAGRLGREGPRLLFAIGAALYARQDWSAAEGYFRRAKAAMDGELSKYESTFPRESPEQAEIMGLLMRSENNLGAALYRVAARRGDASIRDKAYTAFARAARLYDELGIGLAAPTGPEARNLGLLNMNLALRPARGAVPAVYSELERDIGPRRAE